MLVYGILRREFKHLYAIKQRLGDVPLNIYLFLSVVVFSLCIYLYPHRGEDETEDAEYGSAPTDQCSAGLRTVLHKPHWR